MEISTRDSVSGLAVGTRAVFHCAHIRTAMSHVQGTTFGCSEGSELDRLGKDVVAMRDKLKKVSWCDAQRVNISPVVISMRMQQILFHDVIVRRPSTTLTSWARADLVKSGHAQLPLDPRSCNA